jgi:hypothetical protein
LAASGWFFLFSWRAAFRVTENDFWGHLNFHERKLKTSVGGSKFGSRPG